MTSDKVRSLTEQIEASVNQLATDAVNKNRKQRELEAEAIAYVVMRHFGIEHVACNYLATYKIDSAQLKQSLQTISTTAKFLIAAIDPQINEIGEAAADAASDPPA